MGQELYVLKIRYRLWAFLILGNVYEFGSKPGRVGSPAFNWEFLTYVYSLLGSWRLESSTSRLSGSPQCLRVWQGASYLCISSSAHSCPAGSATLCLLKDARGWAPGSVDLPQPLPPQENESLKAVLLNPQLEVVHFIHLLLMLSVAQQSAVVTT